MNIKSFLAALALCTGTAAHAELVANGGFETGSGDGWTLSGNTAFTFFDGFAPHAGSLAAGLGAPPAEPAGLSQTLATTAGGVYRVSFWLQNGADGTADQPNFFSLNWDGGIAEALWDNAAAFGYTQFSYTFTAQSASTELMFSAANFGSFWDLDDVSVTAVVPEPSSAALIALGLLACARVSRRVRS